jgi:hypothetical protein
LDYAVVRARLELYPPGTILLHGDCGRKRYLYERKEGADLGLWKGADKISHDLATRARFSFNPWPLPYFDDMGKAGGPVRNDTMGDVLEVLWRRGFRCAVEGFPIGRSPGTRGCLFSLKARDRRLGSAWSFNTTEEV